MTYKLWIDDQAFDPNTPDRHPPKGFKDLHLVFKVATSSAQAIAIVSEQGLPSFIDFDHDLGQDSSGNCDDVMRFLRWLEWSKFANENPPAYRIHSSNSNGAANIASFMESWKKVKNL